jgi:hypothetical protein
MTKVVALDWIIETWEGLLYDVQTITKHDPDGHLTLERIKEMFTIGMGEHEVYDVPDKYIKHDIAHERLQLWYGSETKVTPRYTLRQMAEAMARRVNKEFGEWLGPDLCFGCPQDSLGNREDRCADDTCLALLLPRLEKLMEAKADE